MTRAGSRRGAARASAPVEDGVPHLFVDVGPYTFALPLLGVDQVVQTPAVRPLAHAPDAVLGVADIGGRMVGIVDLGVVLTGTCLAATEERCSLLVTDAGRPHPTVGLVVSRVKHVRVVAHRNRAPAPALSRFAEGDFLDGLVTDPEGMTPILALDRLTASADVREAIRLSHTVQQAGPEADRVTSSEVSPRVG